MSTRAQSKGLKFWKALDLTLEKQPYLSYNQKITDFVLRTYFQNSSLLILLEIINEHLNGMESNTF